MQIKKTLVALSTVAIVAASSSFVQADESSWADKIDVSGDFRYRMERIDDETKSDVRERSRLRARLNIKADVNETVKVGIRLATGDESPVSANASFDGFGEPKGFGLDRGYVTWTPQKGHAITAGKMAVPFYKPNKSQLIWDGDLNLEGLSYKYSAGGFWGTLGRFNLDECSSCEDSYLNGLQAGYGWKLASGNKVNAGVSYFSYDLNTAETGFADEYSLNEFFVDYQTKLSGRPFVVYANYVNNADADILDSGYEIGATFGKAKNAGEWDFGYLYKDMDANAVFPLFTNSNFAGARGDGKGHIFSATYAVNKNFVIAVTQFLNDRDISLDVDNNPLTSSSDYNRTQLDFKFKF